MPTDKTQELVPTLPQPLVTWLAKLNLLQGVPFNYLVADSRLLAPETIKFFQIDATWAAALLDGALGVGRHYTAATSASPRLAVEETERQHVASGVRRTVPTIRRQQLKNGDSGAPAVSGVITGFLLRSQVVRGWKSLDTLGYAQGSSPYDYERGTITADQVQALDILRLERLSPTVLFGLFQGQLFELVLHQPPEAIHFGFEAQDAGANRVSKTLRVPATSWDDRAATYDSQTYEQQPLDGVFADAAHRVVDMARLSRALAATLASIGKAPGYYQAMPDTNHRIISCRQTSHLKWSGCWAGQLHQPGATRAGCRDDHRRPHSRRRPARVAVQARRT